MDIKKTLRNVIIDEGETMGMQVVKTWLYILVGCLFVAVGFAVFINPYNLVPGGVYGLSVVLHNIFPSIQVGYFGYMLDIPLLVSSLLLLGSKFGSRTVVAVILTPFLMNMVEQMAYPTAEALRNLDPSQMFGGAMDMSNHLMLTTLVGGALVGIGCGLIVRGGATSGGTDVVGMIIQKFCHIPFSNAILMVDGAVVLSGLVVIGFGVGIEQETSSPSWHLSLYSLLACVVTSRTVAFVISGAANDKLIFVISDGQLNTLHRYILQVLDRTATCIKVKGLYSGKEREMLLLVVGRREVMGVKQQIKLADPRAFVIVTDAYDIYGEGFKQLPSENDINPE